MGNSCTTETNSEWEDSSLSNDSEMDVDIETHSFQSNEAFQGWLEKKSKQGWRKRWTVLSPNGAKKQLQTFKEKNLGTNVKPTEKIPINRQIVVSTDDSDDTVFTIKGASKSTFLFKAASVQQRDEWISLLRKYGEYEDNDQYEIRVVDDDEIRVVVMHIATKQSWSALIDNESQREYFQSPSGYRLKVDEESCTITLSVDHPDIVDMLLTMDQLTSPRSTKSDDVKDDDYKEAEPVQPELTEQEKKNMESFKEYTLTLRPVAASDGDADCLRIEMTHIALELDFAVTLDAEWPWKPPVVVVGPHDEDTVAEEVDGAAVNKLFGNEDSSDDEEADENTLAMASSKEMTPTPVTPPPPPTATESILERKNSNAIEVNLKGSGKTAHIELRFELNGEAHKLQLTQTADSIGRLVEKENVASYALYEMAMNYTKETLSLHIDIKHLESGRDFEVTLGDEWLKKNFPQKYKDPVPEPIPSGAPAPIPMAAPIPSGVPAPIPMGVPIPSGAAPAPIPMGVPAPIPSGAPAPIPTGVPIPSGAAPAPIPMEAVGVKDDNPDPKAVNGLFGNDDSSDEEEEDVVEQDVEADSKQEEPVEVEQEAPEPVVEEVEELLVLMECIQKCKESNTLKMGMKGFNKTASIELQCSMDGKDELIVVHRSHNCIQKQVQMEQKEEMKMESLYISGIEAVAESGYGQYCAIEGLVDRHTFKKHKNDAADPQSVNSRKIMRELRKTLAKGVFCSYSNGSMFVRFDESNPRFLQAMLIGLKGTPYFNGCFLFDIYLPDEYPAKPCKVKHVSNGAQLCHANNGPGGFSPNLHQSTGKVCLSLLGTWSGPGWEANKSNVYQLLSTLLLMVFGAEHPYYMEPSYGGWEGTSYSITKHDPKVILYDEEVLYHTAKSTMLGIMKTPYPGFEDVIKAHFRLKAKQIREHMEEMLHSEKYSASFKKKIKPIYEQIDEELKKL